MAAGGSPGFAELLKGEGLRQDVVDALVARGCDNEQVLASLDEDDVNSLGAPTFQRAKVTSLVNSARQRLASVDLPENHTDAGEFDAFLRKHGVSEQTLSRLREDGCDNLKIFVELNDNHIDETNNILPFQKSRLKAVLKTVKPQGKPEVKVVKGRDKKNTVQIQKAQVVADNVETGCKIEGVVHDQNSGKDINIDSIYIDARNLSKGSEVIGVRVTGTGVKRSTTTHPVEHHSSDGTTSRTSQTAPRRPPPSGAQAAPPPAAAVPRRSGGAAAAPPPQAQPASFYKSYQEMPDVKQMVVDSREIKIKHSTADFYRHVAPQPEVYKMSRRVRGRSLVFNTQEEKAGCAIDSDKLTHALAQLHFNVKKEKGPRIVDIRKRLTRHREYCQRQEKPPQCLILCFLSKCIPAGIMAADGELLPYEEIYNEFQGEAAKGLEGIPKIFLFHGPRFNTRDERIMMMEDTPRARPGQDMVAIFPTNEAYDSWRDTTRGTWFIEGFTRILEDSACTDDLDMLLLKVNDLVSRKVSADGSGIMVDAESKLTKRLYLFPGIAEKGDD